MALSTRPPAFRLPVSWRRFGGGDPFVTTADADLDPRIQYVARSVRAVGPDARLAQVMEMLRMGPYRAVPVTEPDGRLLGLATEAGIVAAFLAAPTAEERRRLRAAPVAEVMEAPRLVVTPDLRASEAAALFDAAGVGELAVVDFRANLLGMVARSDLVRDLVRPFQPPVIGGMATPVGVYLTTGGVSAGVGTLALAATGLVMCAAYLAAYLLGQPLERWAAALPELVRPALEILVPAVLQLVLLMGAIRLTPMAGYHAAEHQVVHAVERGEPLLVETVRAMPRVHPRCGTNFVAGGALFLLTLDVLLPTLGDFAYVPAAAVALSYWRSLGGWLQQHLTTRPATDAQIESGILAARELLERHGRAPHQTVRPHVRLWRMGLLQILAGFAAGCALAYLAGRLYAPLGVSLGPWLSGLLRG
jgi:CBS domain-containing protein